VTWTKLPETVPDECEAAGLSDGAFRLHVEALCWTKRRITGGRLSRRDVQRLSTSERTATLVAELLAVDFWTAVGDSGYLIVNCMEHQLEPDLIRKRKEATAERVRRYRRRQARLPATPPDNSHE
jgi:hypothetical protein